MPGKLVVEEGILKGLVFSFDTGQEWIIGRDPDHCQLVLEDPEASPVHAKCLRGPEGLLLENLSTVNPVEVNGRSLRVPHLLQHGDNIRMGNSLFRYYSSIGEQSISEVDAKAKTDQDEALMANVNQSPKDHTAEEEKKYPAQELLQDALKEREEDLLEQDDIFTTEEHAEEMERYAAERSATPEKQDSDLLHQEDIDSIFEEESTRKDDKDLLAEVTFDLLETGRWLLKVIGGPNTGAEFSMQASASYLIGTDPNTCDIVFHDTSVSRQHARITISDEETLILEDLKSRNGTLVDGKKLEGRAVLLPNTVVFVGTTSFVVFDREGEMQTIISPMLPSIVKVLQQEELKEEKNKVVESPPPATPIPPAVMRELEEPPVHKTTVLGAFVLIGLVTGLFIIVGMGTLALFSQ